MSKVIVNDELQAKLNGLRQSAEFCTADGKPLGYFMTVTDYLELLYGRVKDRFSPEEVERLRQQKGGRPLKEILHDLEKK